MFKNSSLAFLTNSFFDSKDMLESSGLTLKNDLRMKFEILDFSSTVQFPLKSILTVSVLNGRHPGVPSGTRGYPVVPGGTRRSYRSHYYRTRLKRVSACGAWPSQLGVARTGTCALGYPGVRVPHAIHGVPGGTRGYPVSHVIFV